MKSNSRNSVPDWERFGLQPQQPATVAHTKDYTDDDIDETDSEENELFREEQKSSEYKPWWKANFFLSERVLFGAWDGVFTSCMLNIFGIIIFLRTGWMVGNAGVGLSMLIIFITLLVASIGAMSSIGICERCKMESGGVYFLLNHVLGGQIAAAVGVLYCFGQAVSCSLYTVGFGESISNLLHTTSNPWVARGFAIGALVLLTCINLAGVKWVIRLQLILLFTIVVAAVDFLIGSFMSHKAADGVLGYSVELLRNNTSPGYTNGQSFFTVFGVFFPTACGVLSGINMSGDLRNPRKAIAQGTIAATALSGTFYVIFVLVLGSIVERWALISDYMISEKVSALGVLWLIGLYVSSITSCMGGLYGAPRILQSIASSNNFPSPLSYLGMGRGANKVPIVSLTVVTLISLIFICVGDVNFLAPIVTMPFLITYIAVDYAYFSLAMTADIRNSNQIQSSKSTSTSEKPLNHNTHGDTDSYGYGSINKAEQSTDNVKYSDEHQESDDDLDHLFPERKLSRSMESGHFVQESDEKFNHDKTDSTENLATDQAEIYQMEPSWYSRFCNRWSSLFGALGTLGIMFATQWLYTIVSITTLALLYMYLMYTIPGASPGIAKFKVYEWIKSTCNRQTNKSHPPQVVVNQHSPLLSTTPAQLNDNNEDFSQRRPYHQSELRPGQELPLCCDE